MFQKEGLDGLSFALQYKKSSSASLTLQVTITTVDAQTSGVYVRSAVFSPRSYNLVIGEISNLLEKT